MINDLFFLDYDTAGYAADPFGWLAQKAAAHKMARSARGVELLDYKLCRTFLLDRAFGTDHANLVERMDLPEGRALEFKRRMLLVQNRGDTRQRLRQALTSLMGQAQADQMHADIQQVISRLVDTFSGPNVDLKTEFADLVPAGVYCGWVNTPQSDARFVADMSETVLTIFRRDPALTPGIVSAYDKLFSYVKKQIEDRRADMGDDFLSTLIRLETEGALSKDELEDCAVMLLEASTDNTSHQIAIAIDRLTNMPDVWQAIAKDAALAGPAVREVMRLWPRSISTSRTALWDTEFGGVQIPKGTSVFASFGAAQRQADVFDTPHAFDLNRNPRPPHMNFGGGAFSCLGQFVASIEVSRAIATLARRFPGLTVTKATREFTPMFQIINSLDTALNT